MAKNNPYKELGITYSFYSRFVKRFFDIFVSLLGIIILSPILLITYLLTLIFLGAPALYKQARPGKNHKVFFIYKFRSMTNKKDSEGNLLPDEKRITWFGKLLRKTSLDELPQLFNILKGDMSIIGPRPRLVKDMVFYDKNVYDYYVVKPGLTGPTQAYGRNKNTWEQVFEKDVAYAQKITFGNDFKIFFKTFTSVFTDRGESHSNKEEDKSTQTKQQEYYYPDYLLRIGKITKEQYDLGLKLSTEIINETRFIDYYPELHSETETAKSDTIVFNPEDFDISKTDNEVNELHDEFTDGVQIEFSDLVNEENGEKTE